MPFWNLFTRKQKPPVRNNKSRSNNQFTVINPMRQRNNNTLKGVPNYWNRGRALSPKYTFNNNISRKMKNSLQISINNIMNEFKKSNTLKLEPYIDVLIYGNQIERKEVKEKLILLRSELRQLFTSKTMDMNTDAIVLFSSPFLATFFLFTTAISPYAPMVIPVSIIIALTISMAITYKRKNYLEKTFVKDVNITNRWGKIPNSNTTIRKDGKIIMSYATIMSLLDTLIKIDDIKINYEVNPNLFQNEEQMKAFLRQVIDDNPNIFDVRKKELYHRNLKTGINTRNINAERPLNMPNRTPQRTSLTNNWNNVQSNKRNETKYFGGDLNQNAELLQIKNKLRRVNKTAIRSKNHRNVLSDTSLYNITHHPWNKGFK